MGIHCETAKERIIREAKEAKCAKQHEDKKTELLEQLVDDNAKAIKSNSKTSKVALFISGAAVLVSIVSLILNFIN